MATQEAHATWHFSSKSGGAKAFPRIAQAVAVALLAGLFKARAMLMLADFTKEGGLADAASRVSVAAATIGAAAIYAADPALGCQAEG
mmetsp:Transcript_2315/g.4977  ORF Transcript_2315/g.4977 Transcript_2315/m.4977 type:complete len:88 (+) Transcript_2315:309-572(+)